MKDIAALVIIASSTLLAACSAPGPQRPPPVQQTYPSPDTYLVGKNIEAAAQAYGNPDKSNTVGQTLFVSYSAIGTNGGGFSNICFLELQSDSKTGLIKAGRLGSNLGLDSTKYRIDVRQECHRLFYRRDLAG